MKGRDYALPDDVKRLAPAVLSNRCIVHPESALRGVTIEAILKTILEETPLEIGDLAQP
jgi:MoxR-like ATPase